MGTLGQEGQDQQGDRKGPRKRRRKLIDTVQERAWIYCAEKKKQDEARYWCHRCGFSLTNDSASMTATDEGLSKVQVRASAIDHGNAQVSKHPTIIPPVVADSRESSSSRSRITELEILQETPPRSSATSSPLSSLRSSPSMPSPCIQKTTNTQGRHPKPKYLNSAPNDESAHSSVVQTPSSTHQAKPCRKGTARTSTFFPTKLSKSTSKRSALSSPFFPRPIRPPRGPISSVPFPPFSSPTFGLVQERLRHDPFRLLVAVTFLNKTRGSVAMPICWEVFARWPTPHDLASAKQEELTELIHGLGFQNRRAERLIKLAKAWVARPPERGKRVRKVGYPCRGDGADIPKGVDYVDDGDKRVAWEIGHLPSIGAYALDSWRIFCRDELRGVGAEMLVELMEEKVEEDLKGEWTRVVPLDKELRAYLRWRWGRCGWIWDPESGEKRRMREEERERMEGGGVVVEGDEGGGGREEKEKKEMANGKIQSGRNYTKADTHDTNDKEKIIAPKARKKQNILQPNSHGPHIDTARPTIPPPASHSATSSPLSSAQSSMTSSRASSPQSHRTNLTSSVGSTSNLDTAIIISTTHRQTADFLPSGEGVQRSPPPGSRISTTRVEIPNFLPQR